MRQLVFASLLALGVCALAQDTTSSPYLKPPDSARQPSIQPGHPLDPYDVDVLTGRMDAAERYQPQMYYSLPLGESQFSGGTTSSGLNGFGFGIGRFDSFRFDPAIRGTRFFKHPRLFNRSRGFIPGDFLGPFAVHPLSLSSSEWGLSQFANVSTSSFPNFRFFGIKQAGFRPRRFFGNGTPAFNLAPRGFSTGGGFQSIAPGFLPDRQP